MGVHCCCLHINYTVYKYFDRSQHVGSSDPTCVQNFRPVPLTVFEIQGFNLKNENDKKKKEELEKWTFCHIFHVSGPILANFRCIYILTSAIILEYQKWIIIESESSNWNFRIYRHNGPRSRPSLYTKYYHTL